MSLALSRVESCLKIKARASDCLMASLKISNMRIWRHGVSLISLFPFLQQSQNGGEPFGNQLPGGKESTCNVGDLGLIPGLRRSAREGNDNPL